MAIEITTLARPYAKAAFEFARDDKSIPSWNVFLQNCAVITENHQTQDLLLDPAILPEARAQFFEEILGKDCDDSQRNFIRLLSEESRLPVLPMIAELFDLYRAEYEKTIDVVAVSFRSISEQQKEAIATKLEKRLGRKVSVTTEIDPTLMGGLVIRAGDLVIDGSVRSRLEKLREQLIA